MCNNFVWPDSQESDPRHHKAEECTQTVLDTRDKYLGSTLAGMYDPDNNFMFPELISGT